MKQISFKIFAAALMSAFMVAVAGCSVKYSFSGANIHPNAQTYSVAYFPNNAAMVTPILSSSFTDALQDKMQRQTRLSSTRENGDLAFEGEIIGYTSTPAAVSAATETVESNRLTITVKVRFTNSLEPEWNFDRSFSAFLDYPTTTPLQEAEGSLIPQIVEILVDDIFNAAVANW